MILPRCALITKSGTQTISGAGQTVMTFANEVIDNGGWFDVGASTTRLTAPSGAGYARFYGQVAYDNHGGDAGSFIPFIRKNGATTNFYRQAWNIVKYNPNSTAEAVVGSKRALLMTETVLISPGDYFEFGADMTGQPGFRSGISPVAVNGTWFCVEELASYRGAVVGLAANQTVTLTTEAKVLLDQVDIDTDSIFDAANNRLVVPPGVSLARFNANLRVTNESSLFEMVINIRKNGTQFADYGQGVTKHFRAESGFTSSISVYANAYRRFIGPIVEVAPGDYFELWALADGTSDPPQVLTSGTVMEMQIIA